MLNNRADSLELLNSTHTFPCSFEFKVIGSAHDDFVRLVLEAVVAITSDTSPPHSTRTTPGGRHVSVSVEPVVQQAEHVLEIYERLKDLEGVVMLL